LIVKNVGELPEDGCEPVVLGPVVVVSGSGLDLGGWETGSGLLELISSFAKEAAAAVVAESNSIDSMSSTKIDVRLRRPLAPAPIRIVNC
jgi:hypothetical protein